MTVPHITKLTQEHLDQAYEYLQEESKLTLNLCNKAIEIALAEQAEPAEPIDHIKLLGEIYGFLQSICPMGIADEAFRIVPEAVRAQAIAPYAAPRDEIGERVRHTQEVGRAEVKPHSELKALYAQQVKEGTLDDFIWEYQLPHDTVWDEQRSLQTNTPCEPSWHGDCRYRCTPKPTCQVRNLDTGELKTMTREAAKLLQAETKDVCDWFYDNGVKGDGCIFGFDTQFTENPYTYKRKENLVKLNGKLMTREAAIALWESKKDTCDVWIMSDINQWLHLINPIFNPFELSGVHAEYQLRPKAKKQVTLDPSIREGVIQLLNDLNVLRGGL